MSAPERRSIPSLTTSKRLIKLKWFKNNDDKYLWMAVLHGLVALRGLQRLNLRKDFKQRSPPSVSPLPFSCPVMAWFGHEAWSGVYKRFIIWHKLMKMILTDSQTTYRALISRISWDVPLSPNICQLLCDKRRVNTYNDFYKRWWEKCDTFATHRFSSQRMHVFRVIQKTTAGGVTVLGYVVPTSGIFTCLQ